MARPVSRSIVHDVLLREGIKLCRSDYEKVSQAALHFVRSKGIENDQAMNMVHGHYMGVFTYIKKLSDTLDVQHGPLIIGISAPQGCGKTTLSGCMEDIFPVIGKKCAVLSLDDFYHTFTEQTDLAMAHPANNLMKFRGNAGTHDLPLAMSTLRALRQYYRAHHSHFQSDNSVASCDESTGPVLLPRYDKSLHAGRGDRASPSTWPEVSGEPADIVIVEGWMLGFEADFVHEGSGAFHGDMQDINRYLRAYVHLHHLMHAWIVIEAKNIDYVYVWRLEAEEAMRAAGKDSLSDEQVKDFVDRFMPAYATYLPHLLASGPQRRESVFGAISGTYDTERDTVTGDNSDCANDKKHQTKDCSNETRREGVNVRLAPVLKVTVGLDRFPVAATLNL